MSDGDADLERQMRAEFRYLCPDARRLLLDRRVFNEQLEEYGMYEAGTRARNRSAYATALYSPSDLERGYLMGKTILRPTTG